MIRAAVSKKVDDIIDRIACHVGTWALRRVFGADCETDVREDWPDEPNMYCVSCDAKRLVGVMQDILHDDSDGEATE